MAAIDFPNPSDINPETGDQYANGWLNDANGVTYVYANNTWTAAKTQNANFDGLYVNKLGGDHMEGPLTIGPDSDPANGTINLLADGSASFAGTNNGDARFSIADEGQTTINSSASNAGTSVFEIKTNNGGLSLSKVNVTADGSASFAGGTVTLRDAKTSGNTNASVVVEDPSVSGSTGTLGSYAERGYLNLSRNSSAQSSNYAIQIGSEANATEAVRIAYDGSATFAGDVTSTSPGFSFFAGTGKSSSDNYVYLTQGQTVINRSDNNYPGLYLSLNGSVNTSLNADGSASFAGTITTQGGAGGPYVAIGETITFNTEADNPANYTTTMVDGEEQQVYNGPTLDVKERLQNLISRLDSLEADEVTDDAASTLLLTTVSNLTTQMTKVNDALTAIRAAANAAGTLDQLKTDIAAATADI